MRACIFMAWNDRFPLKLPQNRPQRYEPFGGSRRRPSRWRRWDTRVRLDFGGDIGRADDAQAYETGGERRIDQQSDDQSGRGEKSNHEFHKEE